MDSAMAPAELADLVDRVAMSPAFRTASRSELAQLLQAATRETVQPHGQPIALLKQGAATEFVVLLEGQFKITLDGDSGKHIVLDVTRGSTSVVGLADVVNKPHAAHPAEHQATVEALTTATYLVIKTEALRTLCDSSPAFRQALWPAMQIKANAPALAMLATRNMGYSAAVVQFLSQIPSTPLPLLIELLAREIASSFPDRVLIVRPPSPDRSSSPTQVPLPGPGRLFQVGADAHRIPGFLHDYDYIFLDGVPCAEINIFVKLTLGRADDYEPLPPPIGAPTVLETVVVGPAPVPCARGLRLIDANASRGRYAGSCRVHLNFEALRALSASWNVEAPTPPLDEATQASFGAWARALTRRRTGVAIAGGGVWSMMGIHVLRQLAVKYQVPVDVITGASGGSIVGGYYAARGLDGLDELIEQAHCGGLNAMVYGSMISGCVMQGFYERSLGHHCIEHLRHAEFYPAISNLSKGDGSIAVGGSLALGIRASSSSPPLVPPTITGYRRLVDGAFTNNVPSQALSYFNTRATFAVNVYPPSRRGVSHCVPQWVTRLNSTVNPMSRFLDFITAFNLVASMSGRVEAERADVSFNARSLFGVPFLIATNFRATGLILEAARHSKELNDAIAEFAAAWQTLKMRGGPPVTVDAAGAPE